MTDSVSFITILLALPAITVSLLSQTELWQRKEYRRDRMLASLMGPELRPRLYPYGLAAAALLLRRPTAAIIILLCAYAIRIARRGLSRPQRTAKAMLLVTLSSLLTLVVLAVLMKTGTSGANAWALTLLLVPLSVALSVIVVNLAANLRKRSVILKARQRRQELSGLTVIGITGSFGKTSTKHFLSQLLPGAIVTKEHRNAEFPVAQDMLEQLHGEPAAYIVEMGAYRRGEIAALTRLTSPRIGVITAIGNQHAATFGSLDNILKGKWELIEALPPDGLAVLNADDERLVEAAKELSAAPPIIWYSTKKPADVYADNITVLPRSLSCRLHIATTARDVSIPLAGEGALKSVVAAVAAAHALGTAPEDIFDRAAHLSPYPQTMEVLTTPAGVTVIDDSYSANEEGVKAALQHLTLFPGKDKRAIVVPLIELGTEAGQVHERISRVLSEIGAAVFVFGTAYERELSAHVPPEKIHFYTTPAPLVEDAVKNMNSETIVLLEGRIPEAVRKAFV